MNQYEPAEENIAILQKADKLRSMVASPGWTEVFEPDLRKGIKEQTEYIATNEFEDLLTLRLEQERIKFAKEMLDNVNSVIRQADQILSDEMKKEQEQDAEQQ
jgi:hypothetical protein